MHFTPHNRGTIPSGNHNPTLYDVPCTTEKKIILLDPRNRHHFFRSWYFIIIHLFSVYLEEAPPNLMSNLNINKQQQEKKSEPDHLNNCINVLGHYDEATTSTSSTLEGPSTAVELESAARVRVLMSLHVCFLTNLVSGIFPDFVPSPGLQTGRRLGRGQ